MNGIMMLDRRDVERLLKRLVHEANRDDVRVEVKFYVQFSLTGDEEFSAQTLVDPWQRLSRSDARSVVQAAIKRLDEEAAKSDQQKALEILADPAPAEAVSTLTQAEVEEVTFNPPAEMVL